MKIAHVSFGGTAAIVTNMALVIGLDAGSATKPTIISSLLIVALADNLTDSLSIHIYQESEHLEPRRAFQVTLANFATRLVVSLVFVLFVLLLPSAAATVVSTVFGCVLLGLISRATARQRNVGVLPEVLKHLAAALVVVVASRAIGTWIPQYLLQ